jgi:hypothetical protein
MTDTLSTDVTAGGSFTPTKATVLAAFNLKFTGTLASAVTVNVPSNKHFYRLHHAGSAHTVTVKVSGQTGVTLQVGDILVYCNGTDIVIAENVFELLANKDAASGYAGLDASSLLKTATELWHSPPSNSGSTGTAGWVAYDANFLYYCYATNSWARIAWDSIGF